MIRTPVSRVLAPLYRAGFNVRGISSSPAVSVGTWNQLAKIDNPVYPVRNVGQSLQRWLNSVLRDNPMTRLPLLGQSTPGYISPVGLWDWDSSGLGSLQDMIGPEIVKEGDETKYRVSVHLGENFPTENVKVSLKDGVVKVDAKFDQTSEDGRSRFYRETTRFFTLPKEIDMKTVRTIMEPNGVLKVEAPIPEKVLQEIEEAGKPKQIPISIEQ